MKKILFVRNVNASWAIRDREILKESHKVKDLFVTKKTYLSPSWKLNVLGSDIVFCWFASLNFFPIVLLGKILGKKIIIISGGFDAAADHTIKYGAFTKGKFNQWLRRKLFSMADRVLCVSKANMLETLINAKVPTEKCELVYHGFENIVAQKELNSWNSRKNKIVMIAQCVSSTFYRKSVDDMMKLAELMPDYEFVLVGEVEKNIAGYMDNYAAKNFSYTGFLKFNGDEFLNLLQESKFIIQMSSYESFGCAVIDGALMGCYPIASSRFSLFEVVAGIGRIYDHGNLMQLKGVLEDVSAQDINVDDISRKVLRIFPHEKRVKALRAEVDAL